MRRAASRRDLEAEYQRPALIINTKELIINKGVTLDEKCDSGKSLREEDERGKREGQPYCECCGSWLGPPPAEHKRCGACR